MGSHHHSNTASEVPMPLSTYPIHAALPLVQVSTRWNASTANRNAASTTPTPTTSSSYLTAALGPKWAHAVNVRLVLERLEFSGHQQGQRGHGVDAGEGEVARVWGDVAWG